jgi:hypothetical protein
MEIGFFLDGAQRYLDNACNVLSIFDDWQWQFSRLGLEKLSCMVAITLRHVNDISSALLACRVSARAKRVPFDRFIATVHVRREFSLFIRALHGLTQRQPVHFASAISGG